MSSDHTPPQGRAGGISAGKEHPTFNTRVANQARIYDYWLGGRDNYEADRKAGDTAIAAYPGMAIAARANRAFLGRVVRYLAAEAGIRQFLDIGTGIPTENNTHEVAQAVAPESRIFYVDYDPIVLAYARALLTSSPEGAIAYLDADLRNTSTILDQAARTLDFSQPVGITLLAILHMIGDDDDPNEIVATLIDAVPSGSYLAVSHPASDIDGQLAEATRRLNQLAHQKATLRSHAEVARFFQGLELVDPGVVQVQEWQPTSEVKDTPGSAYWGGVARKR